MIVGPPLLQEGLAALLARQRDVEVVGTTSMHEAVTVGERLSPDIVIMELAQHALGAPAVVRSLTNIRPTPRVIIICNQCTRSELTKVIGAGAAACMSWESGPGQLQRALSAVRNGERHLGPKIADLLLAGGHSPSPATEDSGGGQLTARERQVVALIAQGRTEREIAKELALSPKTVHTHRTNIMNKLHVHNVIALVRRAIQLGLIEV
jgi:DNA-binding NarL/FixJ family response regulator